MNETAAEALTPAELAFYAEHFDRFDDREVILRDRAVRELAVKCPITHSDAWGGFWLVNRYETVLSVYHDWETFSSAPQRRVIPRPENRPPMPPIDLDPPIQREYRHLLNPYLTPRRVGRFEPGIRALVTTLIDGFIEDGQCDLARQFARPFPGRMLYEFLLGIDPDEVEKVQGWTYEMTFHPGGPEVPALQQKWNRWVHDVIDRRRQGPRHDDMIDALLHGEIDGAPLSDDAIAGTIQILILGGFGTTTDSILYTMLHLAETPDLQRRLRDRPSLIPASIDEFLRFAPPVPGIDRVCTRDTSLEGEQIKAGERVWMFFASANRDPNEFDDPNTLDIDRDRNRHVSFGIGMHRCIGSNVARLNLQVALEELLSRLGEFTLSSDSPPERTWRGLATLPLTFTPGPRREVPPKP
jgi:cytochrome P450